MNNMLAKDARYTLLFMDLCPGCNGEQNVTNDTNGVVTCPTCNGTGGGDIVGAYSTDSDYEADYIKSVFNRKLIEVPNPKQKGGHTKKWVNRYVVDIQKNNKIVNIAVPGKDSEDWLAAQPIRQNPTKAPPKPISTLPLDKADIDLDVPLDDEFGGQTFTRKCPLCDGTKLIDGKKCAKCNGLGAVKIDRRI